MRTSRFLLFCFCSFLTGCGGGSAGAGSDERVGTAQHSALSRDKSMSVDQTEHGGIDMASLPLINDSLGRDLSISAVKFRDYMAQTPNILDISAAHFGQAAAALQKQAADPHEGPPLLSDLQKQSFEGPELARAVLAKDNEKAKELLRRRLFRSAIAVTAAPFVGWDVDVLGLRSQHEKDILALYLLQIQRCANLAAKVDAIIAQQLHADALKDPTSARQVVETAFEKIPLTQLVEFWEEPVHLDGLSIDGRGGDPHWSDVDGDYTLGEKGLIWVKNGVTWLGDGDIFGKKWTLKVANAVRVAQSKRETTSEEIHASAGGANGTKTE